MEAAFRDMQHVLVVDDEPDGDGFEGEAEEDLKEGAVIDQMLKTLLGIVG